MTTAADILEDFRQRAGVDGWVHGEKRGEQFEASGTVYWGQARPAWRLPDGSWYVLPEPFRWDGDSFSAKDGQIEIWFGGKRWHYQNREAIFASDYATAPEAFDAAMKWIQEQGASDD